MNLGFDDVVFMVIPSIPRNPQVFFSGESALLAKRLTFLL